MPRAVFPAVQVSLLQSLSGAWEEDSQQDFSAATASRSPKYCLAAKHHLEKLQYRQSRLYRMDVIHRLSECASL